MAAKFNIVAELSLRGPKNLGPLVKNIQRQLKVSTYLLTFRLTLKLSVP